MADVAIAACLALPILVFGLLLGAGFETGIAGAVVFITLTAMWSLAFAGFGYAVALKTGNPAAVQSMFLLFFPFLFLTTSYVPRDQLSGWLDTVATFNPVTYILDGLRSLAIDGWGIDVVWAIVAIGAVGALSMAMCPRGAPLTRGLATDGSCWAVGEAMRSDPTARTLTLLSLLQTHRHWPGSELAERLGVSERTVRRDVDRLRALGYPVLAQPGTDGGYQLAAGAHLPPLVVDDDEAVALAVGLRAAAGAAIEGIEETTVRVIAKLEQILPDHLRRRVDALNSNVESLRYPTTSTVPAEHLGVLAQACRDHEEARFDYTRRDGDEQRRLVQPHQLVTVGRRWYLVAWDVRRDDWRTFRVDRMVAVRLAGARFEPRPLPAASAAEFVGAGLRQARLLHEATVRVRGPLDRVEATAHSFGADVTTLADGDHVLRLGADELEWLAGMIAILAIGFDIEIHDLPPEAGTLLDALATRLDRRSSPERER